jgi:MoCo/4Fe-4S cofactor protein with predicted Tat translocation signal
MSNRQYWQNTQQLENDEAFISAHHNEFQEELPLEEFIGKEKLDKTTTSRRDFLKFVGFSLAAATAASCEAPVVKSIPYLIKPEEVTPGVPSYYASSFFDGFEFSSILVKTREGRPIYIKGNKVAKGFQSGVSPRVNASVLSLYDIERIKNPLQNGSESSWSEIDKTVKSKLAEIKAKGGQVRLLSSTINSPSTLGVIAGFEKFLTTNTQEDAPTASFKHIEYDADSASGMIEANRIGFGRPVVPTYHFDKAKTIVSFSADFLGGWLGDPGFAGQYAKNRVPSSGHMSKHYQFETTYTLTGSNADVRGVMKPSEMGKLIVMLYNIIAANVGWDKYDESTFESDNNTRKKVALAAVDLLKNKDHSLVVCGINDPDIQQMINGINAMLGSYGNTIDLYRASYLRKGSDKEFMNLVSEMKSGTIDALFILGSNPVYTASGSGFVDALKSVPFTISFADRADETGSMVNVLACDHHYLESWNDHQPYDGYYAIAQPVIQPLFNTRQAQDSLLRWSGSSSNYYDFVRSHWESSLFPNQSQYTFFDGFWNNAVHDGVVKLPFTREDVQEYRAMDLSGPANRVNSVASGGIELELYIEPALGIGNQANNPWLQELPHSMTKVVWDNYITMNPGDMRDENGEDIYNTRYGQEYPASLAKVTINGTSVELPVIALPGQKKGTVGLALGYGRWNAGKVVAQGTHEAEGYNTIGVNGFPFINWNNGTQGYHVHGVSIEPTGKAYEIGMVQTHFTEMGRKIANETSMKTYVDNDRSVWNPKTEITNAYGEATPVKDLNLWQDHDLPIGHRWGMTIDLNLCIGCGACVTACHSENNVPVVGKDEVRRNRVMNWLRIDRYFASDMSKEVAEQNGMGTIEMYRKMEIPSDYPEAVHQPVMCQHCNHAPCETVCPVAATTHSDEGLNQMTYNRCIGTRYCANNCPYKVRRFNWFNYMGDSKFTEFNPSQSDLGRMVLNPDVTVRARGVMEKCSFCVQRIQAGKLVAKKEGRPVQDGDVVSACADACPTHAIQFGDLNDKNSMVAQISTDDRSYHLLEEVGTQPNVFYMTRVRNVSEERIPEGIGHGGGHDEDHGHDHHNAEEHHEDHHNDQQHEEQKHEH